MRKDHTDSTMKLVEAKGLCVKQKGFALKLPRFSLFSGRTVALMGESGSGKSTLLRSIAGLQNDLGGALYVENQLMPAPETRLVPGNPNVYYVSQLLDLMPFWSARDHWDESLRGKSSKEKRAARGLKRELGLKHINKALGKYSGGQLQRVALGKALLAFPRVLLLDEVFNQVDHQLRRQMMDVLMQWKAGKEVAVVFSTHDPEEVFLLADEVMVLQAGKLVQSGTVEEVYHFPRSTYVAGLLGPWGLVPSSWKVQGTSLQEGILVRPGKLKLDPSGALGEVKGFDRYPDRYLVHVEVEGLTCSLWMDQAPEVGSTLGIGTK